MQRREQFRRNPTAAYVGTGVAVIGFATILIAWSGAAELGAGDARLPFLLASGLVGLGLVVVGAAVMVVDTVRRDAEMRTIELGRLAASLAVLRGELAPDVEPAAPEPGAFRPAPRPQQEPADQTVELGAPPPPGSGR